MKYETVSAEIQTSIQLKPREWISGASRCRVNEAGDEVVCGPLGRSFHLATRGWSSARGLTGTFFCTTTTAVSFPRIATAVIPDPVMALKAYSAGADPTQGARDGRGQLGHLDRAELTGRHGRLTDLVQTTWTQINDRRRSVSSQERIRKVKVEVTTRLELTFWREDGQVSELTPGQQRVSRDRNGSDRWLAYTDRS